MDTLDVVTNEASSISEVARQCQLSFEQCLGIPTLMELEWAENRLADYKLWAAGTSVFASSKASLDARLAVEWGTKNLVINILISLQGCIERCQVLATLADDITKEQALVGEEIDHKTDFLAATGGESKDYTIDAPVRSFSPWSDASSEADEAPSLFTKPSTGIHSILAGCKDEVDQIINHLKRIAVVICKAGMSSSAFRADREFKPEDHEELRQHLELLILSRGCEQGREQHSTDRSLLKPIQHRLILANLRRRNRFLYAQRHAKKLAFDVSSAEVTFDVPIADDDIGLSMGRLELNKPAVEENPVSLVRLPDVTAAPAVLTPTSASAIDTINLTPTAHERSFMQFNTTVTTAKAIYPRPPKLKDGLQYFQCPACCQTLPEIFQQETFWKKHLMEDISPYICVVDDCAHAEQMYATRNAWKKHIQEEHQQCWVCYLCTPPGHMPVFPSSKQFLLHIQANHADTTNKDQFAALLSESQVPAPLGISSCPLCDSTAPADSAALLDHIAEHMHEFSLYSLCSPLQKLLDDLHEYFAESSGKHSVGYNVDGPESIRYTDGMSTNLSFIRSDGHSAGTNVDRPESSRETDGLSTDLSSIHEPARSERQKEIVERPVGAYRRHSISTEDPGALPVCPRATPVAGMTDWFTLTRSDFTVCPTCYEAIFAKAECSAQFQLSVCSTSELIACDFGSSPWFRIAWLILQSKKESSPRLFIDLASLKYANKACPENRVSTRTWLGVSDPVTSRPVPRFTVCSYCASMVETLLPNLKMLFEVYDEQQRPFKSTCSLHHASPTNNFVLYFDALETASARAYARKTKPNIGDLTRKIHNLSTANTCQQDKILHNEFWYYPQYLPEFTVCTDCYNSVVRPQNLEESNIARNFISTSQQRTSATTCQLYSSSMRETFKKACRRQDYQYLADQVTKRRKMEDYMRSQVQKLEQDSAQGHLVNYELDKLMRDWRAYE